MAPGLSLQDKRELFEGIQNYFPLLEPVQTKRHRVKMYTTDLNNTQKEKLNKENLRNNFK